MGGLLRILTCVKRGITVDVRHADCRGMSVIEVGGMLRILTCVKRGITVDVRHADCRGMSVIEVGRVGG